MSFTNVLQIQIQNIEMEYPWEINLSLTKQSPLCL